MNQYPEFVDNMQFYTMHSGRNSESQLAGMLSNMKEVFNISHRSINNFNELVRAYIASGLKIFNLETGIVSQIEGDTYTVIEVISNLNAINPGDIFPLRDTYCREVFNCGRILGFPHVGRLPFLKDHPVYQNLKLEAYLSAPIYVDEHLFGTLNFTSTTPRDSGFSKHERDLIVLMADAIGNFLVLQDREKKLKESNSHLKKFVGFVAHDLRNPLGTIRSMAEMGANPKTPPQRIPQIMTRIAGISNSTLDFVHSILDLAALGTGKIEANPTLTPLRGVIDLAIESLSDLLEVEGSQFDIDIENSTEIFCDKNLIGQVFINLLMNAAKYATTGSTIGIRSSVGHDSVNIVITNTIEQSLNTECSEQYKSVGFGLDIAREVLAAHQSELHTNSTGSIYTAKFSLPNQPADS